LVAVHWKHGGGSGAGHDNKICISKRFSAFRDVIDRDVNRGAIGVGLKVFPACEGRG